MRVSVLFACLALPLLSAAQSSQVNSSQTTITAAPSSASQSGSASGSGSATGSGSISNSSSISGSAARNATTTTSVTSILPTAPSTVAGANGGGLNGGAPSPGTSASGGIYGPPDGYIAGAEALRSAGLVGFVGFAVGGALVLI